MAWVKTFPRLSGVGLDAIRPADITAGIGARQQFGMETSTVNFAMLLRMFKLAMEWGHVSKLLPKLRPLPGENRRERAVTRDEETGVPRSRGALASGFRSVGMDVFTLKKLAGCVTST